MKRNTTLSLAILSGKGGVGKSNVAVNLGYALNQRNLSVMLMDCDMGLANMDILLGISPDKFMQDIFMKDTPVEELLVPLQEASSNKPYSLIPSNSGVSELVEIDTVTCNTVCEKVNEVAGEYDVVILDIGAGISSTVLDFSRRTLMRVMVVTAEPTSLTDSYALMKVMASDYNIRSFYILVNQVATFAEAKQTYARLSMVCEKFLGFKPEYLGAIHSDNAVIKAVTAQKPFINSAPECKAAKDCRGIAEQMHKMFVMLQAENLQRNPLE